MSKIIFKHDSRDKIFHQKFGQVLKFPDEINFDTPLVDEIQPIGDVKCTCYTTCDIAEDQSKIEFDIDDLWNRIPNTSIGADPRDVLGEAVKNGLLPSGKSERLKNWKSYWRADLGIGDAFDNIRSSLILAQSPVGVGTFWYEEWFEKDILPIGRHPQNGHMYSVEGWKQINGHPHLIVEAWLGKKLYMSRETLNEALKPYGMQSWILSTSEIDAKRTKTLTEWIKDLCINLIIALRNLIKQRNAEPVVPAPQPQPQPVKLPDPPKYDWDSPELARHSLRLICDEMSHQVSEKNIFCAVMGAESGWNPKAIGKVNSNGTRDYGICQINTYYWIGEGKTFPSTDYVLTHPEECIRWAYKQWLAGHRSYWSAYTNGSFSRFL